MCGFRKRNNANARNTLLRFQHFIFRQGLPQRLSIRARPDLFVREGFEPPTLILVTAVLVAPAHELPNKHPYNLFRKPYNSPFPGQSARRNRTLNSASKYSRTNLLSPSADLNDKKTRKRGRFAANGPSGTRTQDLMFMRHLLQPSELKVQIVAWRRIENHAT